MAIDFIVGDKLIVKQQYVKNTLTKQPRTAGLVRIIRTLEYFNIVSAEVLDIGNTIIFEGPREVARAFIKLLPLDTTNINYNKGRGVMLYFDNDTFLNNSFEYSTAYLCDICSRRGLNNSGIPIPKLAVVRYTGFDTATQLPTISLANATSDATAKVMGMSEEAIADGEIGSIIIEGAISGADTSTYTINDTVYLSDTPGEISDVAGTVTSIVGRAHTVGDPGSISIKGEFPFTPSSSEIAGLFATQYRDFQPINTTAPSATTLDVSTELSAQTPGGSPTTEGVVTTIPDNLVIVRQINGDDFVENVTPDGNKVQARITESSGVWTLSFFYLAQATGVETAFDMTPYSGDAIVWFIQRAYLLNNLPSSNPARSIPSDQIAAEVPDATATIKGKVLLASNGTTTTAGSALDVSDARVGSILDAQNNGTPMGSGPFDTIDFVQGGMTNPSAKILRIPILPDASTSVKGKVQLITDGSDTTAGKVLDVTDARTGAVKGRANAGTVSGFEQIVRIIAGTNISVALVESGGELQFTITNTQVVSVSPGGFGQTFVGPGPVNTGALGFTPIGMFCTGNTDGLFTAQCGGGVGTAAAEQCWAAFNSVAPGTNAASGGVLAGTSITQWSSTNVQLTGGGSGTMVVWGL
jgi:hypothetical protein